MGSLRVPSNKIMMITTPLIIVSLGPGKRAKYIYIYIQLFVYAYIYIHTYLRERERRCVDAGILPIYMPISAKPGRRILPSCDEEEDWQIHFLT